MILNNPNKLANWDIRNLRPARLDSDDGPLMIVDINYPERRDQSELDRGPLRDSAGGPSTQKGYAELYPNDVFDGYGSENANAGTVYNMKLLQGHSTKDKTRLFTVHGGAPYKKYRQYVGYGISPITGYQWQQSGNQVSIWEINNPGGDLSEFHRYYSGHNFIGDSQSWDYSYDNLWIKDLPYGGVHSSYPYQWYGEIRDMEWMANDYVWFLDTNDQVKYPGVQYCGLLIQCADGSFSEGDWGSTFTRTRLNVKAIDSDFLNVGPTDDWRLHLASSASKIRIQQPDSFQNSFGDPNTRKCFMLIKDVYNEGAEFADARGQNNWIISLNVPRASSSSLITADSAQYHFCLDNHPGFENSGGSKIRTNQTYWGPILSFDISTDGKILTVYTYNFAGARALLNFTLTTPWDLSTVEPWDWYDSAAAQTGASGTFTRDGTFVSKSVGRAFNVPSYSLYDNADSAFVISSRLGNIADVKGMTGVEPGTENDPDYQHWNSGQQSGPNGTNIFIQWNETGDKLYVGGGAVIQYEVGTIKDSEASRDMYFYDDSTGGSASDLVWYGRGSALC